MTKYKKIPVAIFLWLRPENTRIILHKILEYKPEKLLVVIDGPRNENDKKLINKVISEVSNFEKKCNFPVIVDQSSNHLGLNKRFVSGFKWIFNQIEEDVIILEDDTIPSMSFFTFCEYSLNQCRHDQSVVAINGSFRLDNTQTLRNEINHPFLNNIFCPWGWATWKSKFIPMYLPSIPKLTFLQKIKIIIKLRSVDLFLNRLPILKRTWTNDLDVWGVQCQWSILLADKYVLTSHKNLITNIGLDDVAATQSLNFHNRLFREIEDINIYLISKLFNYRYIPEYDRIVYNAKTNSQLIKGAIYKIFR